MFAIEADALVKTTEVMSERWTGSSFSVPGGTVFGLLGPNGAGKTTAVKILTTLSRADSGTARGAGLDVLREGSSRCAARSAWWRRSTAVDPCADRPGKPASAGPHLRIRGREIE